MKHMKRSDIVQYGVYLREQERSVATIEKYTRALERFYAWLPEEKSVDKLRLIAYKEVLEKNYAPAGANAEIAAINGFCRHMEWLDCIIKPFRIQRRVFAAPERELSRNEYLALVNAAERKKDHRLALLLQLVASTGIRVSEIKYVTVEALEQGRVHIHLKGKIRTVLLPGKLCSKLRKYQIAQRIKEGMLFCTRSGKALDRREIWAQMKQLCAYAGVPASRVFPHNLRHLFARTFYHAQRDIAKLADVLGHSSIETTRIYLISSGQEHQAVLDRLQLVC